MARLNGEKARENEKQVERLIDQLARGGRNVGATEAALERRLAKDPALAAYVRNHGHVPGRARVWQGD